MRALRILQIIGSLDPRDGGTVECVRQLAIALARAGHVVEVATCDAPDAKWLASSPFRVHALGPAAGRYSYTRRLAPWLRRSGGDYDAWIVHGLWQYPGLAASRIARGMRVPYFVYAHGMLDPWTRRQPLKCLKKVAYWIAAERAVLANAAGVVFMCEEEARLAARFLPGSKWRAVVANLGIEDPPTPGEVEVDSLRASLGIEAGTDVLLFLGRIHPKKGLDLLLRALALRRDADRTILLVAGEGEARYVASLKALAARLGLESRVRWAGPLYGRAKWAAFAAADLFVLSSHIENLGIALVESLAMAKPVCTTRGVNIHDVLERYEAGIVCRADERDLARALSAWSRMGATERAALARNARRCYEREFRLGSGPSRLVEALHSASTPPAREHAAATQ